MHHLITFFILATTCCAGDIKNGIGNVCPDDYAVLGSVAACRAAMDLFGITGSDYKGAEIDDSWPKGCYVCDGTTDCEDGVWFNNHATGAAMGNATPLCAIDGWEAALDQTKVLFVGDSDMDYWDTSSFLEDSQNVGYGGYTCEDTLAEIDEMLDVFKPKWVVMTCGENDLMGGSDVSTTYSLFEQLVDKIVVTDARVITLATKPEPDTQELHAEYEEYDSLVRDLASGMAASDVEEPPPLVMIDTYPSFVALGNPGSLYADDGLHLANDGGYVYWQEWLTTALDDVSCIRWLSGSCAHNSSPTPSGGTNLTWTLTLLVFILCTLWI